MEFCSQLDRSTLELSVFSKGSISFSRCSYLKGLAYLKFDEVKNIDIFDYDYVDNFCKKSSTLCSVKCNQLSKKFENIKIGISKKCNFNCYHCFNKDHFDDPQTKDIYFFILNKVKGHHLNALILGHQGEVFVYYDEIINYLSNLSQDDFKQIIFQTNLSLLNEERIKELKDISLKTNIDYIFLPSINGITNETFKAITRNDCFDLVINNLKLLLNLFTSNNVKVTFTIKELNIDDLPNVNTFFKKMGIIYLNINYDMYDTRCKDLYLDFLNNGQLKCIYETSLLEDTIKSPTLNKYKRVSETDDGEKYLLLNNYKNSHQNSSINEIVTSKPSGPTEKILVDNNFSGLLTIGITCHKEQVLSPSLIQLLSSSKKIKFLISNDAGTNFNKSLKELFKDSSNIEFIYSKPGIENNRQNILSHTFSKYIYIIDYDDEIKLDEDKLLPLLEKYNDEIIMINPYEDDVQPDYIYYSDTQLFIVTWAQIFSTNFMRQVGGYIQTWNFYHEEFGTNANMLANIYSRNIEYNVNDINDKNIIYYNHLLSDSIGHNSMLKRRFNEIYNFVKKIPKNDSIIYKKVFLEIFKERLSLMGLSEKNYDRINKLIIKLIRKL